MRTVGVKKKEKMIKVSQEEGGTNRKTGIKKTHEVWGENHWIFVLFKQERNVLGFLYTVL